MMFVPKRLSQRLKPIEMVAREAALNANCGLVREHNGYGTSWERWICVDEALEHFRIERNYKINKEECLKYLDLLTNDDNNVTLMEENCSSPPKSKITKKSLKKFKEVSVDSFLEFYRDSPENKDQK